MLVNEFCHGQLEYMVYGLWVWNKIIFKIISKLYNEGGGGGGGGMTVCELLPNNLVNAYHYDHHEYMWFLGRGLEHFQDNIHVV